ncbi:MAG: hypothetical protein J6D25_06215, partial [Eggerthellaceae bacterium]|nr:hypothetical protein [Eggerthellaceae bacterium]
MTQTAKNSRSPLKIVTIVVAVIVVILFAAAAGEIREASQGYSSEYDTRDYIYPAESGRFGQLYDVAIRDMGRDADYSTEESECRALAFYYEQAVLEHAYRVTGDDAKADKFAQRMKEYESELGSMSSKAEAA